MKHRISVIAPELLPIPPVSGGAVEHWIQKWTEHVDLKTVDITVFSRPATNKDLCVDGVKYSGVPRGVFGRLIYRFREFFGFDSFLGRVAKIVDVLMYGHWVFKRMLPGQIMYIHNDPGLILFANKPRSIVLHMHNDHLLINYLTPIYRFLLKKVDKVIFVSDYLRTSALDIYPEYRSKFETLFNATDTNFFSPDRNDSSFNEYFVKERGVHYILYVGRLTEVKGVDILLRAFDTIKSRRINTKLVICGASFFSGSRPTKYQQQLRRIAQGFQDDIVFTGFVPHEKLRYIYSACDLVVVPSVWQEPQGLVVLEAMASETCTIASAVGGLPELIEPGVNGFLVSPGVPVELAESILRALGDPGKSDLEAEARKRVVSLYSWERLGKKVVESICVKK